MSSRHANRPGGPRRNRSGNVLVFTAFLMICLMAALALSVDLGYLATVRSEAQRTADAGALAGASALYRPIASLENMVYSLPPDGYDARLEARQFARYNPTGARFTILHLNYSNDPAGDIVLGRFYHPADRTETLDTDFDMPNTVLTRVSLSADHANGPVGLFFARVLGFGTAEMNASAAATIWYPAALPFATSVDNWNRLKDGRAEDHYAFQPGLSDFGVAPGGDGVPEIVMFPGPWVSGDLPPGNFGLIQLGGHGMELTAIRRQIDMGPSVRDMSHHNGEIRRGDSVPGRTGLKSSDKHAFLGGSADGRDFSGMLGRPRQLPLYRSVSGNGANAVFVLDRFVAVRVMGLKIDGRWRTEYQDTEGDDIESIRVQPLRSVEDLIQVQLTR